MTTPAAEKYYSAHVYICTDPAEPKTQRRLNFWNGNSYCSDLIYRKNNRPVRQLCHLRQFGEGALVVLEFQTYLR